VCGLGYNRSWRYIFSLFLYILSRPAWYIIMDPLEFFGIHHYYPQRMAEMTSELVRAPGSGRRNEWIPALSRRRRRRCVCVRFPPHPSTPNLSVIKHCWI
jgi:hypothetical protein